MSRSRLQGPGQRCRPLERALCPHQARDSQERLFGPHHTVPPASLPDPVVGFRQAPRDPASPAQPQADPLGPARALKLPRVRPHAGHCPPP